MKNAHHSSVVGVRSGLETRSSTLPRDAAPARLGRGNCATGAWPSRASKSLTFSSALRGLRSIRYSSDSGRYLSTSGIIAMVQAAPNT